MDPNRKLWLVLGTFILAMAIIACSCGSIPVPSIGKSSGSEPLPGLAGKWHYKGGGTVGFYCQIAWAGQTYQVTECIDDDASIDFQIKAQHWDGATLTWTFYIPQTQYTTTFTTVDVSGDQLTVSRIGTGGTGTEVLSRKFLIFRTLL